MGFSVALVLLNILIFITAVVTLTFALPYRHLVAIRWLFLLTAGFCIVSFCTLTVYVSSGEDMIFFSRMRFLGLALLAPTWLQFLAAVLGRWSFVQRPAVAATTFIPGLVTIVCTLIPAWRDLVVKNFVPMSSYGVSVVHFEPGAWFIFYYYWSIILVFASVFLGISTAIRYAGVKRRQAIVLTLGSGLAAAVDIYCVLANSPLRWMMISSGTFLLSEFGIVYAVFRHRLLNVAPLAMTRIFNDFPDPIFILDDRDVVMALNQSAAQLFKLNSRSAGVSFSRILPDVHLASGEFAVVDERKEEQYFNISIENLDLGDSQGGKIVFFRKITLQKGIEARLNENLEFKARLLGLIAHDLSGYMESQTLLSTAIHADVDPEMKNRTELLMNSTLASKGFVENIVSWVKSQGSRFEAARRSFEWNALISESIEQVDVQLKLKNIKVVFESNSRPLIALGDSDMLMSVLRNLLMNSIRASQDRSRILIRLRHIQNIVEVVVQDEGAGMSVSQIEEIRHSSMNFSFSPKTKTAGYGVGLKIARHFICLHGGSFAIDSSPGVGTRVTLQVPLEIPS